MIHKKDGMLINQYTKEGNLIREYQSIAEADKISGVKKSNIQHALYKEGATAGGFIWKYAQKQPKE